MCARIGDLGFSLPFPAGPIWFPAGRQKFPCQLVGIGQVSDWFNCVIGESMLDFRIFSLFGRETGGRGGFLYPIAEGFGRNVADVAASRLQL